MASVARETSKRHHTVPKLYLRGFARAVEGSDPVKYRIGTVRLPGQQRFVQSIDNAAVTGQFYAIDGHPGGPDVVENALSAIETAGADIFDKITSGTWPLGVEDRMTLGYFIALQATRIPSQRNMLDHLAAQLIRLQVGAGGKAGLRRRLVASGRDVSDELIDRLWAEATRPEGPPANRPTVEHIEHMLDLADDLLRFVVGRPWTLVQFHRRSLITSDAPVALVAHPDSEPTQGVGFMTASEIIFPISRRQGLLMRNIQPLLDRNISVGEVHQGGFDVTEEGTTMLARFFNEHTVDNASEWLYHHPEDEGSIPADLPDPRPFTIEVDGVPAEFTGEPWFKSGDTA